MDDIKSEFIEVTLDEIRSYAQMVGGNIELADLFFWHYESFGWVLESGVKIINWRARFQLFKVKNHAMTAQQKRRDEERAKQAQNDRMRREAERIKEFQSRVKEGTATKHFASKYIGGYLCYGYDWYLEQINNHGAKYNEQLVTMRDEFGKAFWRIK